MPLRDSGAEESLWHKFVTGRGGGEKALAAQAKCLCHETQDAGLKARRYTIGSSDWARPRVRAKELRVTDLKGGHYTGGLTKC
jgi:hypothetical protein